MRSPYYRPWPLPPAVNRAINDHYRPLYRVQAELDRWFIIWFVLLASVIVVSIIAGAVVA